MFSFDQISDLHDKDFTHIFSINEFDVHLIGKKAFAGWKMCDFFRNKMIFMFIYGHMPVPNTICLLFIQSWKLSTIKVMVNLRRFVIECDLSLSKSFCCRRKKRWQWQIIPLAWKWSKYTERQKQDRIFIPAMTFCPYTHEIRCLTKVVVTN